MVFSFSCGNEKSDNGHAHTHGNSEAAIETDKEMRDGEMKKSSLKGELAEF